MADAIVSCDSIGNWQLCGGFIAKIDHFRFVKITMESQCLGGTNGTVPVSGHVCDNNTRMPRLVLIVLLFI